MESVPTITLPIIRGWPYRQIEIALSQAQSEVRHIPVIMVGFALWSLLTETFDAEKFFACGLVPIRLDKTGILEPHEFMVTRR